jgi:predicted dehydrogenase
LSPDLAIILTPTGLHAEHTIDALKNNCHVILEKPMCLKISDGKKIIKLSRKFKKRVFVVMQNKFNLPIIKLRNDIKKNKFGKLLHGAINVRWMRDQNYYDQANWRGTWKYDGGVISNQASHHLDLMRTIMGEPISVYATSVKHLAKIQCEDTALIIFKFKGKKTGILEATTAMRPYDIEGSFSLMGSKGSAKIGGFALNEISYYHSDYQINKKKFNTNPSNVYGYGHVEFYKHFINSINKNLKSEFESFQAIKTVKLINAIYKSIEKKKEIRLNSNVSSKRLGN